MLQNVSCEYCSNPAGFFCMCQETPAYICGQHIKKHYEVYAGKPHDIKPRAHGPTLEKLHERFEEIKEDIKAAQLQAKREIDYNIVELKEYLDLLARAKKEDVDEEAAKALHDVEEAMREIDEDYSKRDWQGKFVQFYRSIPANNAQEVLNSNLSLKNKQEFHFDEIKKQLSKAWDINFSLSADKYDPQPTPSSAPFLVTLKDRSKTLVRYNLSSAQRQKAHLDLPYINDNSFGNFSIINKDEVFLCGDYVEEEAVSNTFTYNFQTKEMKERADMNYPRYMHALANNQKSVYVFAGKSSRTEYLRSAEHYDFQTDRWTVVPEVPAKITYPHACVYNKLIYIAGNNLSKIYSFDTRVNSYSSVDLPNHTVKRNKLIFSYENKLIVLSAKERPVEISGDRVKVVNKKSPNLQWANSEWVSHGDRVTWIDSYGRMFSYNCVTKKVENFRLK